MWLVAMFVILCTIGFIGSCAHAVMKGKHGQAKVIVSNLVLLAVTLVAWRYAFPGLFSMVFYRGLIVHIGFVPPIVLMLAMWRYASKLYDSRKESLATTYAVLGVLLMVVSSIFIVTGNRWQTAVSYPFQTRPQVLEVDPVAIRFTPLQVAAKTLADKYSSSKFAVDLEHADWIDINGGSAFRIPTTPSGGVQPFIAKNEGFVTWDDSFGTADDKRFVRTAQEFQIGEGMLWLDSLERTLYARDPWSYYPDIYYLDLPGRDGKGSEIVAIAPQIKFSFRLPFFWVQTWSGVTLVFSDGTLEQLSVEQVQTDKRFTGKFAFPSTLSAELVKSQKYDKGYASGWYRRDDKPQIPELPGHNQWPFRTKGADGRYYDVTATEPDGENRALFRFYYVDCLSGERSFFEMDINRGFTGPVTAMEYVKQLPGYVFLEQGGETESGTHRIVEPRYVVHDGQIYWLFSITTKEYSKVVSTVLVNAETNTVIEFKERKEFEQWLNGASPNTDVINGALSDEDLQKMETSINAMQEELNRLREIVRIQRTTSQP